MFIRVNFDVLNRRFGPFILYDTDDGCPETYSLSKINRSFLLFMIL